MLNIRATFSGAKRSMRRRHQGEAFYSSFRRAFKGRVARATMTFISDQYKLRKFFSKNTALKGGACSFMNIVLPPT